MDADALDARAGAAIPVDDVGTDEMGGAVGAGASESDKTGPIVTGGGVPDLVPARMANEAAYCPRLFYLEWVQARFEDNADTVDGRWKHRVVDRQSGAVPGPEEVTEMGAATSVLLSSEELGLIGRIDLLEGDGTSVVPVDYKRGGPPANEQRSWEPERIQLCVLGLILRDNGYECDQGSSGSRARASASKSPSPRSSSSGRGRSFAPFDGSRRPTSHRLRSWTARSARGARSSGYACPTSTTLSRLAAISSRVG